MGRSSHEKQSIGPLTMASSHTTLQAEPPSEQPRATEHIEDHSDYGEIVRDVIIGFADGLTVPFALTAGLSSYVVPFSPESTIIDV